MRVGELAKRAGITVRTLQYYDKEGLLSPSAESEGGFRLYSENDVVKLAQILTMKELGFSLSEIKERMKSLDTMEDVVSLLAEQAMVIRRKIEQLTNALKEIEAFTEEIEQVEQVDFQKYLGILVNMQMKNEHYWMIKHFDSEILSEMSKRVSKENVAELIEKINRLFGLSAKYARKGIAPESDKAQKLATEFWEMMMEITGGDMELLQKLNKTAEKFSESHKPANKTYMEAQDFIGQALEKYFEEAYKNE
jgi:DNA-binding transcriptional MerR regulator